MVESVYSYPWYGGNPVCEIGDWKNVASGGFTRPRNAVRL